MRIICAALVAVTVLGGCGDDDEAPIQQPDIEQAEVDASNYDVHYQVCEGIAEGWVNDDSEGITVDPTTDPEAYAFEYASDYEDPYRQAVHDGCLDGLLGRPQSPPG
jgi:hypothetical protein